MANLLSPAAGPRNFGFIDLVVEDPERVRRVAEPVRPDPAGAGLLDASAGREPKLYEDANVVARPRSAERLLRFDEHYRQIAQPVEWSSTRTDLDRMLPRIEGHELRLALAA